MLGLALRNVASTRIVRRRASIYISLTAVGVVPIFHMKRRRRGNFTNWRERLALDQQGELDLTVRNHSKFALTPFDCTSNESTFMGTEFYDDVELMNPSSFQAVVVAASKHLLV